jgi:flagellar biosynthesis protein FlhF
MKIRRFFAADMRQAIRLVREEQGPEAVILSSRRVEGGIEIVAAMDYDQAMFSEMAADDGAGRQVPVWEPTPEPAGEPLESLGPAESLQPTTAAPATVPSRIPRQPSPERRDRDIVWSQDPTLVAMQREIEGLRSMLHDQLASLAWNDLRQREPARAQLVSRLERLGLDDGLAREIAGGVRDPDRGEPAWREALEALAERIQVVPETRLDGEGIIALVGPSGVGKTTTVAKLAARYAQRHGPQSLALVTTDAVRIGAYRQLQTFGQIIGVPVYLAQTGRELGNILAGLNEKQRVFVDTAGMSQRDLHLTEEMAGLAALPSLRSLLVVAANTQQLVLEETFRAFSHLPLEGAVITKLDEAASLGPVLSALCGGDLPLMYVSEGQRVPEDLQPARVQRLLSRAVSLVSEQSETTSETKKARAPRRVLGNLDSFAHASL